MKLILSITEGPHQGKEFTFTEHDSFLVGRVDDAHLQLSYDDPYFSRRHFLLEINPPRCRLLDFRSRNGTFLNGQRVETAEVMNGDTIKAGHTVFKVTIEAGDPADQPTVAYQPGEMSADLSGTGSWVQPTQGLKGYEIIRELGRGGMGVVYQALRLSDRMPVAVKIIHPSKQSKKQQIERFIRESKILEQLDHPNIIQLHESYLGGETIFLAMELVNGPDTGKSLAENGPMKLQIAVRIVCQMLAGLAHAHDLGFVHRDIKPSNLLIHHGDKKVTKLADFGLARVYQASQLSGVTMQGEIGGTPAYMPPEQITHFRDSKPTGDQYSAAATLYTLLTGKHIYDFPRRQSVDMLVHIATEDPIPLRERNRDLPEGLAEIIHHALNREAEDRFPDVREFRKALKKWA
jgi:serine/threonine-protein kinase